MLSQSTQVHNEGCDVNLFLQLWRARVDLIGSPLLPLSPLWFGMRERRFAGVLLTRTKVFFMG
jgi:hypothetical protein